VELNIARAALSGDTQRIHERSTVKGEIDKTLLGLLPRDVSDGLPRVDKLSYCGYFITQPTPLIESLGCICLCLSNGDGENCKSEMSKN
jgi:hypothetical protein